MGRKNKYATVEERSAALSAAAAKRWKGTTREQRLEQTAAARAASPKQAKA